MTTGTIVILVVALLATGGLLAARAGIRSLQRARTVVFYRTRKAYTLAGWQWLLLAIVLFSSIVASALFAEPMKSRFFPQTVTPTVIPSPTISPSETPVP